MCKEAVYGSDASTVTVDVCPSSLMHGGYMGTHDLVVAHLTNQCLLLGHTSFCISYTPVFTIASCHWMDTGYAQRKIL